MAGIAGVGCVGRFDLDGDDAAGAIVGDQVDLAATVCQSQVTQLWTAGHQSHFTTADYQFCTSSYTSFAHNRLLVLHNADVPKSSVGGAFGRQRCGGPVVLDGRYEFVVFDESAQTAPVPGTCEQLRQLMSMDWEILQQFQPCGHIVCG